MIEKIGNVILNYEYYSGQDFYSDGNIEDEILDIVKNYSPKQYDSIISEKNEWPILYHLSHIRGNIIEWLPINKNDSVLEIGSGCGAITGTLSDKAKDVTCIELSKKRSYINAYRNKDKNNIEIMVGNFEDIEKNLEKKYDYITLIGVFEYSESYISKENPYVKFLETVSNHLNENGKLIIAIENKLGLKYWAGCKEDHLNKYYEGIEGYKSSSGVKTFSKHELEKIFSLAQMKDFKFYYPYPDYKLPIDIYSDEYLPKPGELNNNKRNFDMDRIVTFDESKVYDMLLQENLFQLYSNSYLIILRKGKI